MFSYVDFFLRLRRFQLPTKLQMGAMYESKKFQNKLKAQKPKKRKINVISMSVSFQEFSIF